MAAFSRVVRHKELVKRGVDVRLHSCYFSMQYIETTVANQGVIRALFKGLLLYHMHDVTLCFDYMQVRWWCQIKQGKTQKYGANAPHLHHIWPQAASPPCPLSIFDGEG